MLRNEVFHVVPVAIDSDDYVFAVEFLVVFRDLGQRVSDFLEVWSVVFDCLFILWILNIVKLIDIVPVEQ